METKIGELLRKVPKEVGGRGKTALSDDYSLTKKSIGITQNQAQRFQTLAAHPDIVEAAKAEAKKTDMPAEALKQLTTQAQQLGEAVIQTKIRIGELTREMESAQGFRKDKTTSSESRTKSEHLADIGITKQRASECERLARHQDAVLADVKRVKDRGEVPSTRHNDLWPPVPNDIDSLF